MNFKYIIIQINQIILIRNFIGGYMTKFKNDRNIYVYGVNAK